MVLSDLCKFYNAMRRNKRPCEINIKQTTDLALDRLPSAISITGGVSTPYEIILHIANAYVDIGNEIYDIILSAHVGDKKSIACVRGCAHCCHLNSTIQTRTKSNAVGMTLLDGVVLLEHLVRIRHTQSARTIFENMNRVWGDIPGTLDRFLCPFAGVETCAVYAARPMVCRLYFSDNATHCAVQADIPANERQVDTAIAKTVRPIRRELTENAKKIMKERLPDATMGYFDFVTTAHRIVNAVMTDQEEVLRSDINARQSF